MDYSLAKKLKDAGFVQGDSFENLLAYGAAVEYLKVNKPSDALIKDYDTVLGHLKELYSDEVEEHFYEPTLEELIDACGDGFERLVRSVDGKEWRAYSKNASNQQTGKTPSEAVANLWLALQKK